MKALWYKNGKFDGKEKVKSITNFETKHPFANKTSEADGLIIYECPCSGEVARIHTRKP